VVSHCHLRRWAIVGQLLKATRARVSQAAPEWPPSGDDQFRSIPELDLLFLFFSQQTDQHSTLSFARISREQVTETRDVFVANESLHFHATFLFRIIHLEFPILPEPRSALLLVQCCRVHIGVQSFGIYLRWTH
jgi:hypothetical protein